MVVALSLKLTPVRADLTEFRFAFNAKEKHLKKLVAAISTQWKLKVVDSKLNNKVAYFSVKKDDINMSILFSLAFIDSNKS